MDTQLIGTLDTGFAAGIDSDFDEIDTLFGKDDWDAQHASTPAPYDAELDAIIADLEAGWAAERTATTH